jgi:hypothetical protein
MVNKLKSFEFVNIFYFLLINYFFIDNYSKKFSKVNLVSNMGFDYLFLILQKNSSNILSEVINNVLT